MRCPRAGRQRTPCSRAATGLRPQALGPAARSSLMVRSNPAEGVSRQKRGPDAGKTPRWSAVGRSVLRQRTRTPLQGVILMWRHAALHPLGFCPGQGMKDGLPGAGQEHGRWRLPARRHPHLKSSPTIGNTAQIQQLRALLCGNLFGMVRALSKVEVKRPLCGHPRRFRAPGRGFPPPALFKSRLRQP